LVLSSYQISNLIGYASPSKAKRSSFHFGRDDWYDGRIEVKHSKTLSDLTVHCAPATSAQHYQQHTQKHVPVPVQSNKSTQYSGQLTANGELNMNLKKLKTPSVKLKDFAVGVTLATATATSGAP
jgi:hypothetical protein